MNTLIVLIITGLVLYVILKTLKGELTFDGVITVSSYVVVVTATLVILHMILHTASGGVI